MRKLRGNIRHIVCYTVTTGLLENDEWISFDSEDEARELYRSLQERDNISSVILTTPLEGVEYKNGKKK